MADFPASADAGTTVGPPMAYSSRVASIWARVAKTRLPNEVGWTITQDDNAVCTPPQTVINEVPTPPALANYNGCVEEKLTPAFDWFEKFHIVPSSFILGNILTTQQIPVVVYSAFRLTSHFWQVFVNNAGAGTSLLNIPSLPYLFAPQTGLENLILEVTPSGPPSVNTTLVFIFDSETISLPIEFKRLVLWSARPEIPYVEELEFLTRILTHKDGTEQRLSHRLSPRQAFEWSMVLEGGRERARIHNLLFEWQSRIFGVPIWRQTTFPTSAISIGNTTINVRSTAYADWRETPGLALIFDPETGVNDVLEVAAGGITATTLTFVNSVQNNYTTRAIVCPLRTGRLVEAPRGRRYSTDVAQLSVRFEVLDTAVDLADLSAWTTTIGGKVVLDDGNAIQGALSEEFQREVITLDNGSGIPIFDSPWEKGKRASDKTFHATTLQREWQIRQLWYALRGRQTSFYLPTFGKDLEPASQLLSGSTTLTTHNVGYDRYINQRRPYHRIRVHFVNPATPPLIREIVGSSEVSSALENLTMNTTWPATYQPADVKRIEFLELVRADSDTIRFEYAQGEKTCRVRVPVLTVFD